jgi:hypothetical protein
VSVSVFAPEADLASRKRLSSMWRVFFIHTIMHMCTAVAVVALTEGGNRDFSIRVFPNGRHNLLDMSGAAPNEFARLQRFVPGLFELMTSWLVERAAR